MERETEGGLALYFLCWFLNKKDWKNHLVAENLLKMQKYVWMLDNNDELTGQEASRLWTFPGRELVVELYKMLRKQQIML